MLCLPGPLRTARRFRGGRCGAQVADEYEGCAELGEECAGDFAGVCAGVVDGEVLAAVEDVQLVAFDEGARSGCR